MMTTIKAGLEEAEANKDRTVEVELPELDAKTIKRLKMSYAIAGRPKSARAMDALLDISRQPLRILPGNKRKQAIIGYTLAVDPKLDNIMVLNASHSIDETQLRDNCLQTPDWYEGAVVDYSRVNVNVIKHPAGWEATRKAFKKGDKSKLLDEYIDVLKTIPTDQGVIIFTFIDKDGVNCRDILTKRMKTAGIDPEAKVKVGTSRGRETRDRFVWMTHGNEASISKYSYCTNELWCGVLYKPDAALVSQVCGAVESLKVQLDQQDLDNIKESQIATCYHQGFARGACRVLEHGKAKATRVWVTYSNPRLNPLELVKKVMPGIQVERWPSKYVGKLTLTERVAEACVSILSQRIKENPEEDTSRKRISTKALKKMALERVGVDYISNRVWSDSTNIINETLLFTWTRSGCWFEPIP